MQHGLLTTDKTIDKGIKEPHSFLSLIKLSQLSCDTVQWTFLEKENNKADLGDTLYKVTGALSGTRQINKEK